MQESQLLEAILKPCSNLTEAETLYNQVLLYWRTTAPDANAAVLRAAIHTLQRLQQKVDTSAQSQLADWIEQLELAAATQN